MSRPSFNSMTRDQRIDYFGKLENKLRELLELIRPTLPPDELDLIEEFIEHGEYGLALQSAHDGFISTPKLAPAIAQLMNEISATMDLPLATPEG